MKADHILHIIFYMHISINYESIHILQIHRGIKDKRTQTPQTHTHLKKTEKNPFTFTPSNTHILSMQYVCEWKGWSMTWVELSPLCSIQIFEFKKYTCAPQSTHEQSSSTTTWPFPNHISSRSRIVPVSMAVLSGWCRRPADGFRLPHRWTRIRAQTKINTAKMLCSNSARFRDVRLNSTTTVEIFCVALWMCQTHTQ